VAPHTSSPTLSQASPLPAVSQPRQPGLFAQMATTAAGVAVGSAVGHTVGAAITGAMGGGSSRHADEVAAPLQQAAPAPAACGYENEALVRCLANNPSDISMCQSYVDMLNQCRRTYGQPSTSY
jgi:hypothetical protein